MQHKVRVQTSSFPFITRGKCKAIAVLDWAGLEVPGGGRSKISRKSTHADAPTVYTLQVLVSLVRPEGLYQ